jgi:hypothetical protein
MVFIVQIISDFILNSFFGILGSCWTNTLDFLNTDIIPPIRNFISGGKGG